MTYNKNVRRTFLSLRADMIRSCRSLPVSNLTAEALSFLYSLTPDEGAILEGYPVLFREINCFLATGLEPSSRLAWLSNAVRIAQQGFPDESLCEIIRIVRQVLGFYSRLTVGGKVGRSAPWTAVSSREENADKVVRSAIDRLTRDTTSDVVPPVCDLLAECLFGECTSFSALFDGHCDVPFRHGPGAVAEGKRVQRHKSLVNCIIDKDYDWVHEPFFRPLFVECEEWDGRYSEAYRTHIQGANASRIVTVPKDFRGPRVIAAEPALHQYVQQGLARLLISEVAKTPLRYCIDLEHSEKNARAAMLASMTGEDITIDLSDASDMVSSRVVETIFRRTPLAELFGLARTRYVSYGKETFELSAFAPMGSGLCFPVETLVFAIVAIGACWRRAERVTLHNIRKCIKRMNLRVYGDDILVHSDYAQSVIAAIGEMGAVVNTHKTCVYGSFKESCGVDAYGGYDITPLRPRHLPGASVYTYSGLRDNIQDAIARGYYSLAATLLSFYVKAQTKQGFRPSIVFCSDTCQFAGKPGIFTVPDDVFDVMSFFTEPVRKNRLRVIWPRSINEPDDPDRRLREALRGAPRDDAGFLLDTRGLKPTSHLVRKHVRAVSNFVTPMVIECDSLRQATRLLTSL